MTGPADIDVPVPPPVYRCPGEVYTISRAIHLARLVQGYHGCRQCPRADDTAGLSERQKNQLAEAHSRPATMSLFYEEGVRSPVVDRLSPIHAESIAKAFANCLMSTAPSVDRSLQVVVANDGRACTAALNAAICDGIRSCGPTVLDAGPASAACLVQTIEHYQADGGLLIGTPGGFPNGVGIKFWTGNEPVSQGDLLTEIEKNVSDKELSPFTHRPPRTTRHTYGQLVRISVAASYLDTLRPLYHALRPLRLVLGTTCRPIERYLDELTQNVACKMALRDRPIARLAEQILSYQAHFAIEIDDDGESCLVWDERGQAVPAEKLFAWIAKSVEAETAVVEATASAELFNSFRSSGLRTIASDPHRQTLVKTMKRSEAMLGGGPSGRIWYAGYSDTDHKSPVADALQTLTLMFNLLSRSDRPLSAVLD